MSTVWHPVGPAGAKTYWRRRIVLLTVLAAPVAGAVVLVGGGGQEVPEARAGAVAASATASPAPTGEPSAQSAAATTAATEEVDPAEQRTCSPDELQITAGADAVSYGPHAKPKFTLRVANASDSTCTVEVGSAVERFAVSTASGERVWSSEDCRLRASSTTKALPPGAAVVSTQVWAGNRTEAGGGEGGCPTDLPRVPAGEYAVSVALGELTSEPRSFGVR